MDTFRISITYQETHPKESKEYRKPRSGPFDVIDHLDETNPYGVVLHNDGPYENEDRMLQAKRDDFRRVYRGPLSDEAVTPVV